jgi:hypothetical protein
VPLFTSCREEVTSETGLSVYGVLEFSCDYCGEWIEDISKGNPHALYQKGDKEPSFVHQPCSRASVHSRGGQFHSWEPLGFFMARLLHNSKYDAERAEEGAKISGRL